MTKERKNLRIDIDIIALNADASALESRVSDIEDSSIMRYNPNLTAVGLKDASGLNRDFFIDNDVSLFIKDSGEWHYIHCVSVFK